MNPAATRKLRHGLIPMSGRDPHEPHRSATPLELLYDLTLVVAFSITGSEFAHAITSGHLISGLLAFAFCMFAVVWAWGTFTWFSSSYDTDDWAFRIATLVQMLGVTILALGIGDLFHGFEQGVVDNRVMVVGYVIMRLSMVSLWLRAARNDAKHRAVLLGYTKVVSVAQVGWVATAFIPMPTPVVVVLLVALFSLEIVGTTVVETRIGRLPLHPHHIAERFGLLAIITFGEVVLGTTTAVSAVVTEAGWTPEAGALAFAGIAMVVGMWWIYFAIPSGEILAVRRDLALRWTYVHLFVYATIAATGAGLHAVALLIEDHSDLGKLGTIAAVAIPLVGYVVAIFVMFLLLLPGWDSLHTLALLGTAVAVGLAIALALTPVSIAWPVLVLTLTPWVTVAVYETRGHQVVAQRVEQLKPRAKGAR